MSRAEDIARAAYESAPYTIENEAGVLEPIAWGELTVTDRRFMSKHAAHAYRAGLEVSATYLEDYGAHDRAALREVAEDLRKMAKEVED